MYKIQFSLSVFFIRSPCVFSVCLNLMRLYTIYRTLNEKTKKINKIFKYVLAYENVESAIIV